MDICTYNTCTTSRFAFLDSAGFVLALDYRAPRFYLWSLAPLFHISSYLYRDILWWTVNTRRVRMKWTVENMGFIAEVRRVINNFDLKIFQNADERGIEKCSTIRSRWFFFHRISFSLKIIIILILILWEKKKNSKCDIFSLNLRNSFP